MNRLLADLRIVELSAFVAAPLGGMTMAQFGAEVIRIDPIGGGIDFNRWPVTKDGESLYWAGMNKAKRSVALALDKPEGREVAQAIAAAPGPGAGIVLTNLPPLPGLDYAGLKSRRGDVILLRLIGNRDGSAAVDYTVNAASGFPMVTGPTSAGGGAPVNNVLPAWDIAAGLYLATSLLAADRRRTAGHDHRADAAAMARTRPRDRAHRQIGDDRRDHGGRSRHRDRPLRGARCNRGAGRAVVRRQDAGGNHRGLFRQRRVVGP